MRKHPTARDIKKGASIVAFRTVGHVHKCERAQACRNRSRQMRRARQKHGPKVSNHHTPTHVVSMGRRVGVQVQLSKAQIKSRVS